MEIQKAEEFVQGVHRDQAHLSVWAKQEISEMIRARDKAIIERCKGAILASWIQGIIGTADIEYILGCVAKDLE